MSFNLPECVAEAPPIDDRLLFEGVGIDADVLNAEPVAGNPAAGRDREHPAR
jgi:hypothetical protein